MEIVEFSRLDDLAPYAEAWDRLAAGVPFRAWAWMSCWWRHYGPIAAGRAWPRLVVLGALDSGGRLVGLAPWCIQSHHAKGRVLCWLGSGEVCSEYLSVLCQPSLEEPVAEALADYLAGGLRGGGPASPGWDLLEIDGVDARDLPVACLVRCLADRGCLVHSSAGLNCWRIDLPATWDQYLAMLSKGHRKQLRRLKRRMLDTGQAVLHTVKSWKDLPQAMDILIELHERRRWAIGQSGCFTSHRFASFHRDVMPRMLAAGHLELHWLELDGRPVAAEYHLAGGGITYAYQGGMEPQALAWEPGRLITLATLHRAIAQGRRAVDFLRGDEPWKAHLRALRRPSLRLRIVPDRPAARLRHSLWLAGRSVKRWMQSGWAGGDACDGAPVLPDVQPQTPEEPSAV